ncbi:MAG TPA: stage II sporulation protein M, partial [Solirubrobacteraceae bacterium]|nr:stage II sporulation protein M [Solirubrobacteraceae bacterium]
LRSTRGALRAWQADPWPTLGRWFAGSFATAVLLLLAVWAIGGVSSNNGFDIVTTGPPFLVGGYGDALTIFARNLLVLALHAMACVAGFIAGSSLPLQAERHRGWRRAVHRHGGRIAIGFVVLATTFSLTAQAVVLGGEAAAIAARLHTSVAVLLVSLLPHAPLELTALFLPLSAWIIASRRGEWSQLLAATLVTVLIALPLLFVAALIETFVSPHLLQALVR